MATKRRLSKSGRARRRIEAIHEVTGHLAPLDVQPNVQPKRVRSRAPRRFSVRRQSWRPGHYQKERLGPGGGWRDIGTYAVKMLQRQDDKAGLAGAAFWNRVLNETVRTGRIPSYVSERNPFYGLMESLPPHGSRKQMIQSFVLRPEAPEQAALALSASFGLICGRLWRCRKCGKPFVRSLERLSQQTCDNHTKVVTTAAGLPRSVNILYRRLQKRLNVWVSRQRERLRKTLPAQEVATRVAKVERRRRRRLHRALSDARRVEAGRLTLDEWRTRHDRKGKPGRPRIH